MAKLDYQYYDYNKISALKRLTDWNNIQEGYVYHIPPTILYDRRDFVCIEKDKMKMSGKAREGFSKVWKPCTIYYSEISAKFIVERKPLPHAAKIKRASGHMS